MATKRKKNATIQKAARKLNLDLTKLIIAVQQLLFRQPKKSVWSSTGTYWSELDSQMVAI